MKFMRRFIFICVCVFLSFNVSAQILKERRVYYLDCSFSMKFLGLWDPVRENLKNAIDNISDEQAELLATFKSEDSYSERYPICLLSYNLNYFN